MSRKEELIVVVEDSPETRHLLVAYLEQQGYTVEQAGSGGEFLANLEVWKPALVVLDIELPDTDGLTLALDVRRKTDAGIIFATIRDNDFDRVAALELGGDDYVTKPINLREFLARVRSVLRRRAHSQSRVLPVYDFLDYSVDLVRRELRNRDGERLSLTSGEFNILAALVVHAGQPVTREYLLEAASPRDTRDVSERTVDTLIRRLRRKLEPNPHKPRTILTVHGIGYRIDA
ncbi:MAG: response regulator transcription factor [Aquisalimonadaceae bacterium]